jgi:hypothetical protein
MSVAKRKKKWMKGAFKKHKRGALHRRLRIAAGELITLGRLSKEKARARRALKRAHARGTKRQQDKALRLLREIQAAINAHRISLKRKRARK